MRSAGSPAEATGSAGVTLPSLVAGSGRCSTAPGCVRARSRAAAGEQIAPSRWGTAARIPPDSSRPPGARVLILDEPTVPGVQQSGVVLEYTGGLGRRLRLRPDRRGPRGAPRSTLAIGETLTRDALLSSTRRMAGPDGARGVDLLPGGDDVAGVVFRRLRCRVRLRRARAGQPRQAVPWAEVVEALIVSGGRRLSGEQDVYPDVVGLGVIDALEPRSGRSAARRGLAECLFSGKQPSNRRPSHQPAARE